MQPSGRASTFSRPGSLPAADVPTPAIAALVTGSIVAVALWGGGLLALGAFAAPAVFGNVPAPWSGDAMTIAFRRFDSFSLGCAALALVCEVGLATIRKPIRRRDLARGAAVVAMGALAIYQATSLSPHIESLHKSGVVRGVGAAGLELHAVHEKSRMVGQGVLLLALFVVVLHVARSIKLRVAGASPEGADEEKPPPPSSEP